MNESTPLADLLGILQPAHRAALAWFDERAGQIVPWPRPLPDGTFLASKAKGIYKPKGSRYALSIRRSLNSPYPDREPEFQADGLWSLAYFQESLDLSQGETLFTNVGLINCWRDVVPVGVLDQVQGRPNQRYRVLGLALVAGIEDGYFLLQGISRAGVRDSHATSATRPLASPQERADQIGALFDPTKIEDERRLVVAAVRRRQGQGQFRRELLDAYGRRCAMTGYDAVDSLEAAHIVPYRGPVTNHPSNGLLLRADMHSLFDLGLLTVDVEDPKRPTLLLDGDLMATSYSKFNGKPISVPEQAELRPSIDCLRIHRELAGI